MCDCLRPTMTVYVYNCLYCRVTIYNYFKQIVFQFYIILKIYLPISSMHAVMKMVLSHFSLILDDI